jgi:ArsR family transcriptional regulator
LTAAARIVYRPTTMGDQPARTLPTVAGLARALGHPARVRIVQTLIEKEACIGCDLVDETGLAQSTVSEHLRILKSAGIITGEIERPRVCYSLNPAALEPLRRFLVIATRRTPRAARRG